MLVVFSGSDCKCVSSTFMAFCVFRYICSFGFGCFCPAVWQTHVSTWIWFNFLSVCVCGWVGLWESHFKSTAIFEGKTTLIWDPFLNREKYVVLCHRFRKQIGKYVQIIMSIFSQFCHMKLESRWKWLLREWLESNPRDDLSESDLRVTWE